jgi:hypothetical protein
LRVLNEKEVSLQTTSPLSYLVVGIHVITGNAGSKYTPGQRVTIGPNGEIEARVTAIGTGGSILGLSYDEARVYPYNLETIQPQHRRNR